MNDEEILHRISALVDEEHHLEQGKFGVGLDADEAGRLAQVEVALDQCWDLLRQRRARRNAGLDPDSAAVRDVDEVEHYQQ
jgi:Protein of unknown function (DUF2630)